jgi:hypothetical protein
MRRTLQNQASSYGARCQHTEVMQGHFEGMLYSNSLVETGFGIQTYFPNFSSCRLNKA